MDAIGILLVFGLFVSGACALTAKRQEVEETDAQRRERLGWRIVHHQMSCSTPKRRLS